MTDTSRFELSWDLPHPPAKVWRALTDPALLAKWLMPTETGPRGIGEPFQFKVPPMQWWDGIVNCEVQQIENEKLLRYTWKSGQGPNTLDTVVTWTLRATDGGTHLALEHSGFLPTNKFAFGGARDGWLEKVKTMEGLL